ncbi:hypothetical protein RRG08_052810 [Elysia crispata]|uniref:Uncharacterized protein n=1 Tax=Elysia crispata TaxID=231223 RepID=A0AAE1B855_9GAST|nr:hypothetical protein RRG08_052810 [Elysia crispata]
MAWWSLVDTMLSDQEIHARSINSFFHGLVSLVDTMLSDQDIHARSINSFFHGLVVAGRHYALGSGDPRSIDQFILPWLGGRW